MQDRTEAAGSDALAKLLHFRMESTVISEAQGDTCLAGRGHSDVRIVFGECERFLAEDVLPGLRCRNNLLRVHRVWCAEHHCLNVRIFQQSVVILCKAQLVSIRECFDLGGNCSGCTCYEADEIAPLSGFHHGLSPPTQSDDSRVDHKTPLAICGYELTTNCYQRRLEAISAPSRRDFSFSQTAGSMTHSRRVNVPKPQSALAITRSRSPTAV